MASASTPVAATAFPDGTGSITVPAGWQIASSYRGSVDVRSTVGAAVVLGLSYSIIDPNSGIAPPATTRAMARPGDVATALRQVLLTTGGQLTRVRVRVAPVSFPGVPAYYVLYQFDSGGKALTAIGYFTSIVFPGTDFWQLYTSAIVAPTAIFAKTVPTMSRMWAPWRPNGQAPTAGSKGDQIDKLVKASNARMDKIQAEYRETL